MKKIYFLFLLSFSCFLSNTLSAQKVLLRIDGLTNNGSTIEGFTNFVEISGVQYNIVNGNPYPADRPVQGRATFGEVSITKRSDQISTTQLTNIALGKAIPKLEIAMTVQDQRGGYQVIQKIELNDVYVTSVKHVAVEGCPEGCGLAESVTLAYRQIRVTLYRLNNNGSVVTNNPGIFSFDVNTNKVGFDN
jgi:type VI protein secretion system component Hcp